METIRRSDAENFFNGCEYAGWLSLNGVKSSGNANTESGVKKHAEIEEYLVNNIIPENLKFALSNFEPTKMVCEKTLLVDTGNEKLTCIPDAYIIKGNKSVIFDWKFTAEEEYITEGYKYKTFQPLWYAYALFTNYPEVKTILFQYILPNTQQIIEPNKWNISDREETIEYFERNILKKLNESMAKKENECYPNFANCKSCFFSSECKYLNLDTLKEKSTISLSNSFELTQNNVGDVYNLCNQLEAATKKLKERVKNAMETGQITTFTISDKKCVELIEKKGRKAVDKDLLEEFLKEHGKTYEDFCVDGKPIISLQQKVIKK